VNLNFTSISSRSKKIATNVAISFGFKGVDIVSNLLLVPILLNYLGEVKYGVWITVGSSLMWFFFLDAGLGNGLRNKLSEAIAQYNNEVAKSLVSTAYFLLATISIVLFIFFIVLNTLLDWGTIFNINQGLSGELTSCLFIVLSFGCAQFVLKLVHAIYTAHQEPAYSSAANSLGMLGTVICLYWASSSMNDGSLTTIAYIFSGINLLVIMLATLNAFLCKYKELTPKFSAINLNHSKDLLGLGSRFFILQIGGIIVLYSDNIIISQIVGPAEVTPFSIAFKYFKILSIVFGIITYPYWSAYTEAYIKNDMAWIKNSIKKLVILWCGLCIVGSIMLYSSEWAYDLWIGELTKIPFQLSLMMLIFALMTSWLQIFTNLINAVGKIKLQIIIGLFEAVVNIPLSIYLAKMAFLQSSGVILATVLIIIPACALLPIQYRKLVNKRAKGIWYS